MTPTSHVPSSSNLDCLNPPPKLRANDRMYTIVANLLIINSALFATTLVVSAVLITPLSAPTLLAGTTTCLVLFVTGAYFMPTPLLPYEEDLANPLNKETDGGCGGAEAPLEFSEATPCVKEHSPPKAVERLKVYPNKTPVIISPTLGGSSSLSKDWYTNLFVTPQLPLAPIYPADPLAATAEELALCSIGLDNPSCNCFMNASLQSLFQDPEVSHFLMSQLHAISAHDRWRQANPCIPSEPRFTLATICPIETVRLNENKDALVAALMSDTRYQAITTPLGSYSLEDVLTLDLRASLPLVRLYMTVSIKQTGEYAYALLSKWQSKTPLTANETRLLRLSLVKLMNRQANIKLKPAKGLLPDVAEWILPGLNSENLSILASKMEEANEFSRVLIDSLDELTAPLLEGSPHNPLKTKVTQEVKAFRLPTEGSGLAYFDPSLHIEGAVKRTSHWDTTWQVTVSDGSKYRLDNLSFFSAYASRNKPQVTYQKDENIPNTAIGDTVSETISYAVTLPSKVMMWIQAGDTGYALGEVSTKHKKTELEFTDADRLSVTLPASCLFADPSIYLLTSFTVHRGPSLMAGHYYSYSRKTRDNGTDYWVKQNDSTVTACPVSEVKAVLAGLEDHVSPNMLILRRI